VPIAGTAQPSNGNYALNRRGYGTHQAIANRVRPGSRVLDVGCASGYFMQYLREIKQCDSIGIEVDMDAARQARKADFTVIHGSAEQGLAAVSDYEPFDHIIFGDVLEHMADPVSVLAASSHLLNPSGTALVSLPNIVSLRARFSLLLGVWRYEDAGIFDRTHLRFFSVATGRELITESGFRITHESFVGPLTFYGGRRFLPITAVRPGLLANQMVFEAHPI
jgi:methionine biosynthesis protein MetW